MPFVSIPSHGEADRSPGGGCYDIQCKTQVEHLGAKKRYGCGREGRCVGFFGNMFRCHHLCLPPGLPNFWRRFRPTFLMSSSTTCFQVIAVKDAVTPLQCRPALAGAFACGVESGALLHCLYTPPSRAACLAALWALMVLRSFPRQRIKSARSIFHNQRREIILFALAPLQRAGWNCFVANGGPILRKLLNGIM